MNEAPSLVNAHVRPGDDPAGACCSLLSCGVCVARSHMRLLEELAAKTGARYVSDLKHQVGALDLERALREVPSEAYTAEEWRRAAVYLIPSLEVHADASSDEVRELLLLLCLA